MSEDRPSICPRCGAALIAGPSGGVCPRCVANLLQGTQTGGTGQPGGTPFIPPAPSELASKFPQLDILELLGRGGMGAVYKAQQKQLDRMVALKILPPGICGDPAFSERFAREARALAKLHHPNIVTLYEFGETDGQFYFLMEFVDGANLRQLLNTGRIAPKEALAIVPQICHALQFAHDHGIVHRDIKPENILLTKDGTVKIADFGVAKIVTEAAVDPGQPASPMPATGELSEAQRVIGTPQYMAPEQQDHPQEVDHRADTYSLGVVFYQMLTGELPDKRLEPPSKKVVIDVRLDQVVLRALEKEPDLRWQTAADLRTQVETIATDPESARFPDAAQPCGAGLLALGMLSLLLGPFTAIPGLLVSRRSRPFTKTALAGYILCWCGLALTVAITTLYFFSIAKIRMDGEQMRARAEKSLKKTRDLLDGDAPAVMQQVLTVWRTKGEAAAVSSFLEADWGARPLFTSGSTLSLSEEQFAALPAAERSAKSGEINTQIDELRKLAAAVERTGAAATAKNDFDRARKCFDSLKRCGRALDTADTIFIVRLAGQSMEKKAVAALARLPKANETDEHSPAVISPEPATAEADVKKPSAVTWDANECTNPLMLPENYEATKYGNGKYTIKCLPGPGSTEGSHNIIDITFQASAMIQPEPVAYLRQSPLKIKGYKMSWGIYKTVVEGRPVFRKELITPNFLPRQNQGNGADYLRVRIDADSQEIIDQLTTVAGGILRDAAQ